MDEQQETKKFSEEYKNEQFEFEGERCEIGDVLDKEIKIYDFAKMSGTYGEFCCIDGELNGKRIQFLVGSQVVISQLDRAKQDNNLPISATITKRHSEKTKRDYYTLS